MDEIWKQVMAPSFYQSSAFMPFAIPSSWPWSLFTADISYAIYIPLQSSDLFLKDLAWIHINLAFLEASQIEESS